MTISNSEDYQFLSGVGECHRQIRNILPQNHRIHIMGKATRHKDPMISDIREGVWGRYFLYELDLFILILHPRSIMKDEEHS